METKRKLKVLFVCVHNGARSQMAEVLLNQLAGDEFESVSAGLEPGELNPVVIEVLQEIGLDITQKKTQGVFELYKSGQFFLYEITVCDETIAEKCPIFPGVTKRLHWNFPDPSGFTGSKEEKLEKTRQVRDTIVDKLTDFINQIKDSGHFVGSRLSARFSGKARKRSKSLILGDIGRKLQTN